MSTRRRVTLRRPLDDVDETTAREILLRRLDLDLDDFARQRASDEHDATIGIASNRVATRDESIQGELHLASVRQLRETPPMSDDTEWYWDLDRKMAVPSSERGPADNLLGPYPSRAEAENWKAKVEERNDGWDDADEEWNEPGASNDAK